jgi:glycosyltransferase involved in cell wall biosynthesis
VETGMKKNLIGAIGYFGDERTPPNGQAIRTANVTKALEKAFPNHYIQRMSYHEWRRRPVSTFIRAISICRSCENVVIFPDANAIKALVPLVLLFRMLCRNKIYYVVIGGWIVDFLQKRRSSRWLIRQYNCVFVQTATLLRNMNELGIQNVKVLSNFKVGVNILSEDQIRVGFKKPLPLCFYSRVIAEKGVEDLVLALRRINSAEDVYTLDIYGPIGEDFRVTFDEIIRECSRFVRYMGTLSDSLATDTLSRYFMQVFPTRFPTEGFPGSILDSYNAGLPVLIARWNSWQDVVSEGVEGLSYAFADVNDLTEKLKCASENIETVGQMRRRCLERAKKYESTNAIQVVVGEIIGNQRA